MKRKLALGIDLWLVKGAKRSAIYDLEKGIIIQIRKDLELFLIDLVSNKKNIQEKIKLLKEKAPDLYKTLKLEHSLRRLFKSSGNFANIDFTYPNYMLWVEVTDACNQKCLHCYTESKRKGFFLDADVLKKIIKQASGLSFEQIQFTGGEPFVYPGLWDFIEYARVLQGIKILEIYTNLTLIEQKDIDLMKKYQVKIATTLLGSCSEIHDKCTNTRGSFNRFMTNIRRIRDAGIDFRVGLIRLPENQDDISAIQRLMQKEKLISQDKFYYPDDVRPVGRGEKYKNSFPKESTSKNPDNLYLHINRQHFNTACYWNTCWGGELAISSKGDVFPCIFARNQLLGNIYEQDLDKIINGPAQNYWKIKSDKIDKCKDCEYRYACMDCRVLSIKAGNGLFGKPARCNYDPYQ